MDFDDESEKQAEITKPLKNLWGFMYSSLKRERKFNQLKMCIQKCHENLETVE